MRQLSRLGRPIDTLRDSPAPSALILRSCPACRPFSIPHHLLPRTATTSFSTLPSRPARRQLNTDPEKLPFTERLRRKIWGTDAPPGQIDPYDTVNRQVRAAKETIDEVPVAAGGTEAYSPATTWDGLEHVGGYGGWWEKNWDPEHGFKASMCFIPPERLTSPQALTGALHRAVVEVFTLQQAGRPLGDVSNIPKDASKDITLSVQVSVDERGVSLVYPDEEVKEEILRSAIANEVAMEEDSEVEAEEVSGVDAEAVKSTDARITEDLSALEEHASLAEEPASAEPTTDPQLEKRISSWGPSWLSIPLTDPTLKFAILKRTTHLTGHLIPDPKIPTLLTASSLLTHLITPPPPKKLAQALLDNEDLIGLPNVKVFDRRITPVDREKEVGRWKVIERELEERGLPVLGRG